MQSEDARDAADVVSELLGFVAGEGTVEEGGLAVAEPFLEDLVADEGVVPHGLGHVFPAGGGVEVDVEVALASGAGGDLSGAGHGDAALAGVTPAGGDGEVGGNRSILASCLRGARNGPVTDRQLAEAFEVGVDFEGGDAFDGRFGIEQGGDLAAEGGSGLEDLGVQYLKNGRLRHKQLIH